MSMDLICLPLVICIRPFGKVGIRQRGEMFLLQLRLTFYLPRSFLPAATMKLVKTLERNPPRVDALSAEDRAL